MRLLIACLLISCTLSMAYGQQRPKVGLVLSGGGAKGTAHLGVLKVLEQHRIPIDYIAGTSIGAYVGGMYALGYSAAEIEAIMLGTDWNSGYSDTIPRQDLSIRDKAKRDQFNIPLNIGYSEGEIKTPSGLLRGQTMARLLRQSAGLVHEFDSFDQLAIPFRAVATDLVTSRPVILDSGSLVNAMQASATVPAALQPSELNGRLLVDGGIANNMPVDVAKAMGADIIIAVDIGSPLMGKDKLDNAISVLEQLSTMLTNASTEKQKQLLTSKDILIRPAIDDLSSTDFDVMAVAFPLGEQAAIESLDKMRHLSLTPDAYFSYIENKKQRLLTWQKPSQNPVVKVVFENDSKLGESLLHEVFDIHQGETVDKAQLDAAIARLYALDKFERVETEFRDTAEGRVLVVKTKPKSWGPNYIEFGFSWEDDFTLDSSVIFDVAYTMTDLTDMGGEWRNELKLGFEKMFATEFYQPLDLDLTFYSRSRYQYDIDNWEIFDNRNNRALEFDRKTHTLELGIGYNFIHEGAIEIGLTGEKGRIGNDAFFQSDLKFDSYGAYLKMGYDSLDSISFPTSGNRITLDAYFRDEAVGSVDDRKYVWQYELEWKGAVQVSNHAFVGKAAFATIANDGFDSIHDFELGGFLNLSGYHKNSLFGAHKLFGAFIYQYDLGRGTLGLTDYPLYLGTSIEAGNVWHRRKDINIDDLIYASSLYLGTDTGLGPAAIGIGASDKGEKSFYLFVGKSF